MEEADALGDRVSSVIGKGKVQAQGTSLIENEFGIGFHLHIVKSANAIKDNSFSVEPRS